MDFIEISSEESDSDVESKHFESQDMPYSDGDTSNRRKMFEMPVHSPQLQPQKRTLPHSLSAFGHVPKPTNGFNRELVIVPQQEANTHVGSEVAEGNDAQDMLERDAEFFQSNGRSFASSYQPDSSQIDNSSQILHDDSRPNVEFPYVNNGKLRILPKSLSNGQSSSNTQDNGENSNFRQITSHVVGGNAFHQAGGSHIHNSPQILNNPGEGMHLNDDTGPKVELPCVNNSKHRILSKSLSNGQSSSNTQDNGENSNFRQITSHVVGGNAFHQAGGSHIHNSPQILNNPGEGMHLNDDTGPKVELPCVNNSKHRILPKSLSNGQSFFNTRGKSSSGTRGNGQKNDFQENTSHLVGENAAFRVRSYLEPVTNAAQKASNDVLMQDKSGTFRVLPPSLAQNKFVNGSQPIGTTNDRSRLGQGEDRHTELDERMIYEQALQNLSQPKTEDDLPAGLLSVSLLKHQKIALAWMTQKEKSMHCAGGILADDQGLGKTVSTIALIQKQISLQSEFKKSGAPCSIKSVTLDLDEDDDGVADVDKKLKIENNDVKIEKNDRQRKSMASSSRHVPHSWKPPAGTLVVCPASVLRQWERELREKVTETARLSVALYHGGGRTKSPADLAKYDVVLTTYAIVTNEVPKQNSADDDGEQKNMDKYGLSSEFCPNQKQKRTDDTHGKGKKKGKKSKYGHLDYNSGPLARVRWFRVVLDEAQTIKNHRTQVAIACCGLRAKRRWCLSGTPIQNSIDDLFSYFRFLKYDPYAEYSSFCTLIKLPISRNAQQGYKKLQAVLKTVLLRRTKDTKIDGEPIVKIPPKTVCLKRVDFSPDERDFYVRLETDSRQQFKKFDAAGTVKQNYASILVMLLRLRQACDHPSLAQKKHSDTVEKHSFDMAKQLPREMLINLMSQLDSLSICGVCSDPPEDAVVTMCGHVFCYQCVSDTLTGDDNQCPQIGCKEMLGADIVFTEATLRRCISSTADNNGASSSSAMVERPSVTQPTYVSSKIKATLEILNSIISEGPAETPVKAIVFSQWTGMLDLVEDSLNQFLIQYRRLDGTMSLNARDAAVKDFNTDPEVTVMLMSLKAGNLGLNMTAASHVILLDLWWNPSAEDQAVDRAHRIGQTRTVTISRLTISETVEDRILALQEDKRVMISSAFGEDQNGTRGPRLTVDDLRYLFLG